LDERAKYNPLTRIATGDSRRGSGLAANRAGPLGEALTPQASVVPRSTSPLSRELPVSGTLEPMISLAHLVVSVAVGVWPLQPQPVVVQGFDPPAVEWEAGHRGVDLRGAFGQPVHAGLPGTISFAGRIAGRGVVVVDHGATRTTYEPVVAQANVGDHVVAGQVIGSLELFGSHCLPRVCLHWGLIEGADHYLDPLTLVGCGPQPVRLLPLHSPAPPASGCATTVESRAHPLVRALVTLVDALAGRPSAVGPW
jgi:murein DD-endopeptidase MepM/ murein hydrolase activator NlpD